MKIPRNTGRDIDNPDRPVIEHLGNCPVCGALVDVRDLAQVTLGQRQALSTRA